MKVLEFMSFNPEWFLTLPGILITGGVVLLLIALAILLTSNKKGDMEDEEVSSSNNVVSNESFDNSVNNGLINNTNNAFNLNNDINKGIESNTNVQPVETLQQPNVNSVNTVNEPIPSLEVSPVANNSENNVTGINMPYQNPIEFGNTINNNVEENKQNVNIPVVDFTPTVEPTVAVSEPVTTSTEFAKEPIPVVEQPQAPQATTSVYGGVNPTATFNNPVEKPKPVIYGGADPLENTAPLPKIESHTLYNQPITNQNTQINEATVVARPEVMPFETVTSYTSVENKPVEKPIVNDEIETLEF